jgi:hypothetical protein
VNPGLKVVSAALSAVFIVGAVALGGGHPLSPAEIARNTRRAADNAARAAANTRRAAGDTRALATIANNVSSQLETSRKMLATQLRLEASSRRGATRSSEVRDGIRRLGELIAALERRLVRVTSVAEDTAARGEGAARAARDLERMLSLLGARFDEVVSESRELNRKARGFSRLRGRP